jgi:aerobic-type carbon monoxide dehydrogenase small subunit (CoxS/CutS family)
MSEKEKKQGISRREFLKDAGMVVGGATVGSLTFLSACSSGAAAGGSTATVTAPGQTVTTTVTATGTGTVTTKYIDPIDGSEWPTLEALQAHFNAAHPMAELSSNFTTLNVNGTDYGLQVNDSDTLIWVLREKLGLFGTKMGCDAGQCGSCTVLVDGVPMFACVLLANELVGKKIQTVEGLSNGETLNPLQQKFYDQEAFQCGFCTPGILMASTALLAANPKPTADDVREALGGHVCACTNFSKVVAAVTGGV